jgi:hypothetical protein
VFHCSLQARTIPRNSTFHTRAHSTRPNSLLFLCHGQQQHQPASLLGGVRRALRAASASRPRPLQYIYCLCTAVVRFLLLGCALCSKGVFLEWQRAAGMFLALPPENRSRVGRMKTFRVVTPTSPLPADAAGVKPSAGFCQLQGAYARFPSHLERRQPSRQRIKNGLLPAAADRLPL